MCLTIPVMVRKIDKDSALVDYGGVEKKVSAVLVDDLVEGDFVIIKEGFIIQKLDRDEAIASLELIKRQIDLFERNSL